MKGTRKNPAVKKYAEMLAANGSEAETLEALKGDKNAYTEDEVTEIWDAVTSIEVAVPKPVGTPVKQVSKAIGKPTTYQSFDKWMVHVEAVQVDDDAKHSEYRLRFIKPHRTGVKITQKNADDMNAQTQNNSVYYALSGSVETGQEITIKVSRGKTR